MPRQQRNLTYLPTATRLASPRLDTRCLCHLPASGHYLINSPIVTSTRSEIPFPFALTTMSFTHATATSLSNFDSIFNTALEAYKKQTKNDLTSHPLLSGLQSCDSPNAILTVLREQIPSFGAQSQSGDDAFSTWLAPTVNVLYAFSATLAGGVGIVNIAVLLRFWGSPG